MAREQRSLISASKEEDRATVLDMCLLREREYIGICELIKSAKSDLQRDD